LRIRSTLYHHGVSPGAPGEISGPSGREFLASLPLPLDASERVVIALGMIDMLEIQIHELERALRKIARHQAGCQALMTQFGVGELIALVTLTELGDVRRMSSSRKAVRFAGIDPDKDRAAAVAPRDDRSTIMSRSHRCPTTQIRPGAHGATRPNH
jgi:transposase